MIVSSGDGGWIHLGPHVAEVLATHDFFVVGVDVKAYLESFTSGSSTLRPEDEPRDYSALEVRAGDGSRGWPEQAPFDAIIASAGAPAIPEALKEQLDIGGRLVMPVGDMPRLQTLLKVRRISADRFAEEDLGAVAFVVLGTRRDLGG